MFLPMIFRPRLFPKRLVEKPVAALLIGITGAIMIFSHLFAISMIQAAYMISIKRTSLIFGVIYGALWFKEKETRQRLLGASVMVAGVFLIGWFG
jgi:drug/metabolite transporter (DMT)-like permease